MECWLRQVGKQNQKKSLGARTLRGNREFFTRSSRDHANFSYALKYFNQRPEDKRNFSYAVFSFHKITIDRAFNCTDNWAEENFICIYIK